MQPVCLCVAGEGERVGPRGRVCEGGVYAEQPMRCAVSASPAELLIWFVKYVNNQMINK